MFFIGFIVAVFASVRSFMLGFSVSAANLLQLDSIPVALKESINSLAVSMGVAVNNVQTPEEIVNAGYLLLGAAVVGLLGGLFCLLKQKNFSGLLLLIAAAMCGGAGFIADGSCGEAFVYLVAFLIASIMAFTLKSKQTSAPSTSTSTSTTTASASKAQKNSVITPSSSQKVNLKKGDKVNLTKSYPISKIVVGLGWSADSDTGVNIDLDASAFLLTANDKVTSNSDFVFYSQRVHPSGAVEHMGDNLTGSSGEADDEQIKVDLSRVPASISKIVFTVTIYEANERGQNFGQISNAFIRIFDEENSRELLRYNLNEKFYIETAVVCGELYRNGSEWEFNAIGRGSKGGLEQLCRDYGVNV